MSDVQISATAITPRNIQFWGEQRNFFPLVVKGLLFVLVTLGIYRFWYLTDLRRYYWNHTSLNGSAFEYTGRGLELFIGFLIALAIFIPLQVLYFIVTLSRDPVSLVVGLTLYLLVLSLLIFYATYRARRYRLTRTTWQGLRFRQTGSAWGYAWRAFGWRILSVLSLGLVYPWMTIALERYMATHTWYGDIRASFGATPRSLYRPCFFYWSIVYLPFVGALVYFCLQLYSGAFTLSNVREVWPTPTDNLAGELAAAHLSGTILMVALGWLILAGILFLPYIQARVFKILVSGYQFGVAEVTSHHRARSEYVVYAVYMLFLLVPGSVMFAFVYKTLALNGRMTVTAIVVLYLVMIVFVGLLNELVLKFGLWQRRVSSITVSNLDQLQAGRRETAEDSALGEGLTDAFDVEFGY